MDEYRYPENFSELVSMLSEMNDDEWADNDDSGHHRYVEIVNMEEGRYGLYEDNEWLGCAHDVVSVAQFLAEGWEY